MLACGASIPLKAESAELSRPNRIDAFNGPFGKIVAGLSAEGQGEPAGSSGVFLTDGLVLDGMLLLRISSAARMPGNWDRTQNLNC
jgi:hypothetical protein